MSMKFVFSCVLLAAMAVTSGCAAGAARDNWVKTEVELYDDAKLQAIATKYDKNIDNLTARLNASKAFPYIDPEGSIPHSAFFEKKRGEVTLSLYLTSFTRYNVLKTTKNSRCYDIFQEYIPEYLTMIKKAALLRPGLEFKTVTIGVSYEASKLIQTQASTYGMSNSQAMAVAVANMRAADEMNSSKITEMASFTIPLEDAKKFVDQDIDIDELLSKSIVILNGVRVKLEKKINTQDEPIE